MKIQIEASTKSEMVKEIVKRFGGFITVERAKGMVSKGFKAGEKMMYVKTPAWFRFRGKGGKFVKAAKVKGAKKITGKVKYNRDTKGRFKAK